MFWFWLENEHPKVYEGIQWAICGLSLAALLASFIV